MTRPAVQLYTVRNLNEPLQDLVRRVADAGFEGVEFAARFDEADLSEVATALAERDVEPIGVHVDLEEFERNPNSYVEKMDTIGCHRLIVPHVPADSFNTVESVAALGDRLERIGTELADSGVELLFHNGDDALRRPIGGLSGRFLSWDLLPAPVANRAAALLRQFSANGETAPFGQTGLGRLAAQTDPDALSFEVDAGWARAAGYDPSVVLDLLGERSPLVHLHDVQSVDGSYRSAMPGEGVVDLRSVVEAASANGAEWLVYEHDDPDDPAEAIRRAAELIVPLVETAR